MFSDWSWDDWTWTSWETGATVILSAPLMMIAVTAIIRVVGLRSLSKMTSTDFVVTVAIGSIMASTVATSTPLVAGILAMAALLAVQAVVARLRRNRGFGDVVDNQPMLLMRHGEMIDEALDRTRVTRSDVVAKLREANVLQFHEVQAVVLETTGDISVLHGDVEIDEAILDSVVDCR